VHDCIRGDREVPQVALGELTWRARWTFTIRYPMPGLLGVGDPAHPVQNCGAEPVRVPVQGFGDDLVASVGEVRVKAGCFDGHLFSDHAHGDEVGSVLGGES